MLKFDDLIEAVRYFKGNNESATSLKAKEREEIKMDIELNVLRGPSHVDDEFVDSVIKVFETFNSEK